MRRIVLYFLLAGPAGAADLWVATDLHVLADPLHDQGTAFTQYALTGAGRDIAHSTVLFEAFLRQVLAARPAAVVLTGDLTNQGERASHQAVAEGLARLDAAGIRTFVVPGNHDVNNPLARRFAGDKQELTDSVSPAEFAQIYARAGYAGALSRDPASLSYLAEAAPGLWLLLLDSANYEDNLRTGRSEVSGALRSATRTWLASAAVRARKAGVVLVAALHHSVTDHSPVIRRGYTINDAPAVAALLVDSGVRLALTGHIHIQDVTSRAVGSDTLVDAATGALSVWPNHYAVLTLTPGQLRYRTASVDVEGWARATGAADPALTGYRVWSEGFFRSQSTRLAPGPDADVFALANERYFAGREALNRDLDGDPGFLALASSPGLLGDYVMSIVKDSDDLDDNAFTLPVAGPRKP